MSAVVAIGERAGLEGYALAGVEIVDAGDGPAARRAWNELAPNVELLLLDAAAHASLAQRLAERPLLWVVVPE